MSFGTKTVFGWYSPTDYRYTGPVGVVSFLHYEIPVVQDLPNLVQEAPYPDYIISICSRSAVVKLDKFTFDTIVTDLQTWISNLVNNNNTTTSSTLNTKEV